MKLAINDLANNLKKLKKPTRAGAVNVSLFPKLRSLTNGSFFLKNRKILLSKRTFGTYLQNKELSEFFFRLEININ